MSAAATKHLLTQMAHKNTYGMSGLEAQARVYRAYSNAILAMLTAARKAGKEAAGNREAAIAEAITQIREAASAGICGVTRYADAAAGGSKSLLATAQTFGHHAFGHRLYDIREALTAELQNNAIPYAYDELLADKTETQTQTSN